MHIRKIDLNLRRDIKKFVMFPFELYKDCEQWIPPLISAQMFKLNTQEHPYYQHSTADFYVLEDVRGQVIGRIGLLNNTRANEQLNLRAGMFTDFDVIEDETAARMLLDQAESWAREHGFDQLYGPKGQINTDSGGLLVEGFEHRPALNVPYNYPYYKTYLEHAGFRKERDSLSGYIHIPDADVPERVRQIADRIKERRGFWIMEFNTKDEMRAMVDRAQKVLNDSFRSGPGYVEMTDAEFQLAAADLISIADPRLIKVVMKDDVIIGYLFAYHDVSAGLQKARGRLFPLGWWHILRAKQQTKWVNVNGVGILPEYQGLGANAILYTTLADTLKNEFDFEHADTVYVGEDNYRSFSDNETMGVTWYKRHRIYIKDL